MSKKFLTGISFWPSSIPAPLPTEVHFYSEDGEELYKRGYSTPSVKLLHTGDIKSSVAPSGSTGDNPVSETGIREAISNHSHMDYVRRDGDTMTGDLWLRYSSPRIRTQIENANGTFRTDIGSINDEHFDIIAIKTLTAQPGVTYVYYLLRLDTTYGSSLEISDTSIAKTKLNVNEDVLTNATHVLVQTTNNGTRKVPISSFNTVGGSGLSSVGLSMPNMFDVSNSPLTSDGTISVSLKQQAASKFLASPATTMGAPSFRSITADDIPALPYDNYSYFTAGITGALVRVDGYNYAPGSTFRGISFYGGTNVSLTQTAWGDGTLLITINANASGGGLTSVGLSMPNIFTVGNSPLTANGTIAVSLASQLQNRVFASPNGSSGTPTFRGLMQNDIPDLSTLYDKYENFTFGINNADNEIVGGNGSYYAGLRYTGIALAAGSNVTLAESEGAHGEIIVTISASGGSSGGLTSVGLSMPNIFSVSNSPLIANGTLSVALVSQIKNKVLASPDNTNGVPSFRMLTQKDIPDLSSVYDKYQSFYFRTKNSNSGTFITTEVQGTGNLSATYDGIAFDAGAGISMEPSSTADGLVMLTISATGGGSGGTENTLDTLCLLADVSLPTGTWTTVLEMDLTEVGLYFLAFQASMAKGSTGSATILARLIVNDSAVISSAETYTSAYKAALSGHGYATFGIGKSTTIKLQVYSNSSSWYAKAYTATGSQSNATQLTSIKIS